MTSKELSELLQVSKRTINNKIQKLKIEPTMIGNRYDISAEDAEKIIKAIYPRDNEKYLAAAKEKYLKTRIAEDILSKNEHGEKENKKNENDNEQSEKINENNENVNEQSEKDFTNKLIEMLQKSLEDKENTIRAQQNQIDMLIKSNAMLTKRLEIEDKQEKDKVIVSEPPKATAEPKQSWFRKLFGGNSTQEQKIEV